MKIKLINLLLVSLLFSCAPRSVNTQSSVKPTQDTSKYLIIGDYHLDRTTFKIDWGSDGHEYAHNVESFMDTYVCFHYIECRKCKKQKHED